MRDGVAQHATVVVRVDVVEAAAGDDAATLDAVAVVEDGGLF